MWKGRWMTVEWLAWISAWGVEGPGGEGKVDEGGMRGIRRKMEDGGGERFRTEGKEEMAE